MRERVLLLLLLLLFFFFYSLKKKHFAPLSFSPLSLSFPPLSLSFSPPSLSVSLSPTLHFSLSVSLKKRPPTRPRFFQTGPSVAIRLMYLS